MHSSKIWGEKYRLFENDQIEVDILILNPNSFCSIHKHQKKYNRFILLNGEVQIVTEYGIINLNYLESYEVIPGIKHEFRSKEASSLLEIAYVKEGKIDPNDIIRFIQGGFKVNNELLTESELRKRKWLHLSE